MLYLSGPVWTFEGSPNGYFVRNVSAEVRDIAATGGVRWMGVGVGAGGLRSENLISRTSWFRSCCDSYAKTRFPNDLASCLSEICGHSSAKLMRTGMRVIQIMVDL